MIFVDTGAWFALAVPSDADHAAAKRFLEINREPLFTTDYVVDELLTLFRVRRQTRRAEHWLTDVYRAGEISFVRITPVDFDRAVAIYRGFADKQWSFTECTSFCCNGTHGRHQSVCVRRPFSPVRLGHDRALTRRPRQQGPRHRHLIVLR